MIAMWGEAVIGNRRGVGSTGVVGVLGLKWKEYTILASLLVYQRKTLGEYSVVKNTWNVSSAGQCPNTSTNL